MNLGQLNELKSNCHATVINKLIPSIINKVLSLQKCPIFLEQNNPVLTIEPIVISDNPCVIAVPTHAIILKIISIFILISTPLQFA